MLALVLVALLQRPGTGAPGATASPGASADASADPLVSPAATVRSITPDSTVRWTLTIAEP